MLMSLTGLKSWPFSFWKECDIQNALVTHVLRGYSNCITFKLMLSLNMPNWYSEMDGFLLNMILFSDVSLLVTVLYYIGHALVHALRLNKVTLASCVTLFQLFWSVTAIFSSLYSLNEFLIRFLLFRKKKINSAIFCGTILYQLSKCVLFFCLPWHEGC